MILQQFKIPERSGRISNINHTGKWSTNMGIKKNILVYSTNAMFFMQSFMENAMKQSMLKYIYCIKYYS